MERTSRRSASGRSNVFTRTLTSRSTSSVTARPPSDLSEDAAQSVNGHARIVVDQPVAPAEPAPDEDAALEASLLPEELEVGSTVHAHVTVALRQLRIVVDDDVGQPRAQEAPVLEREEEVRVLDEVEARIPRVVAQPVALGHEELMDDVEHREAVDPLPSHPEAADQGAVLDLGRALQALDPEADTRPRIVLHP